MRTRGSRRLNQRETGARCPGNLVQKIGPRCRQREIQTAGARCRESLGRKTGASLWPKMETSRWSHFQLRFCRGGTRCPRNRETSAGEAINRYSELELVQIKFPLPSKDKKIKLYLLFTAVRLHVYLVFVKSIEQEPKIQ